MIPRLKPNITYKELLASLTPTKGKIEEFEYKFANQFSNINGVMFAHGRTAIYALLKVWNLNEAEIICPAYTCVVVPHAIVLSGNTPVFVDCEEGSFNMSLDSLKSKITNKTRCIIATHLFGYPLDLDKLEIIKNEAEEKFGNKIYVIQDCAHSFGVNTLSNKPVSTYGDASIYGLNISKVMTSIFGGMVITNSIELNESLIKMEESKLYICFKFENLTKNFIFICS